jgi:hypothetical protein
MLHGRQEYGEVGRGTGPPASKLISGRIAELGDWRGKAIGRVRRLIKKADPDIVAALPI